MKKAVSFYNLDICFVFFLKIDVYSFGVLLCEMSIPEELDKARRSEQVATITNENHRKLVVRCVDYEPDKRPKTSEIIHILERAKETPRMAIKETS